MSNLQPRPKQAVRIIDGEYTVIRDAERPCYEMGSWPPKEASWAFYTPLWIFIVSALLAAIR